MPPDPFASLGLPRRFDLDPGAIERAYLLRSANIHPDVVGGEEESQRLAAELNAARSDLLDGERRANVLLGLLGGPSKEQDRSLPPGFLEEMMEVRQEMESDQARGEFQKWREWGGSRRLGIIRSVATLFGNVTEHPGFMLLSEVRTQLNALRYIERMLEQVQSGPGL